MGQFPTSFYGTHLSLTKVCSALAMLQTRLGSHLITSVVLAKGKASTLVYSRPGSKTSYRYIKSCGGIFIYIYIHMIYKHIRIYIYISDITYTSMLTSWHVSVTACNDVKHFIPLPTKTTTTTPTLHRSGRFMACTGGWDWAPYSYTQTANSGNVRMMTHND